MSDEEVVNPQGPADDSRLDLDDEARERRRAALAQMHTFGDPVLKSPASPVTEFDSRLVCLAGARSVVRRLWRRAMSAATSDT